MRWTVGLMTTLLIAGTAGAQSPGAPFLGGFGQWTHFDGAWNLNTSLSNSWGWGARVGAFIAPGLSIEGDGSYTRAKAKKGTRFLNAASNALGGRVKASTFGARLVYTFPSTDPFSFHIGGGGVLENFKSDAPRGSTYQYGVNGLGGVSLGYRGLEFRVDGFADYLPSNSGRFDFGIQAGVQFSPYPRNLFGSTVPGGTVAWAPYAWWDDMDAPLPGTVEIGGALQGTSFNDYGGATGPSPKNGLGYAARIGVFLSDPSWEIEGDGYYSPENARIRITSAFRPGAAPTEVNASAIAARLNYNLAVDSVIRRPGQLVFGIGGVRTNYKFKGGTGLGSIDETYTYNFGVSGLAGARVRLANRTNLRLDVVGDLLPGHKPSANFNVHFRGGMSVLLGGGRREAMCTFSGLESVPLSSPKCVAPTVPVPPPTQLLPRLQPGGLVP